MEVNILDSSIGLRIREVRNRFGLSQTEFGKRLDVSRDVINNLELSRLKKDPGALLRLICKTYNVNYFRKRILTKSNIFINVALSSIEFTIVIISVL